ENGQRRPGLFFALWGTASKLAYALAVGMIFPVLDAIGFDATSTQNLPEDIRILAILYAAPSLLFKGIAIALMWSFPLDEAEHARIRQLLAERESSVDSTP
ncbi:MAG: MFS transporter, partial [Pseudomonadota bacterium]